ncbi:hypothetical protein G4B88_013382 [Cannabis sativa]|uniref:Uncharacterized protein n=1 Tax=Cannabis sativa TaxID=3483 RepID=A0A7J6FIV0_CANSA|nr:hypothetical protein G4B88_013382 [Cannabis sativa]
MNNLNLSNGPVEPRPMDKFGYQEDNKCEILNFNSWNFDSKMNENMNKNSFGNGMLVYQKSNATTMGNMTINKHSENNLSHKDSININNNNNSDSAFFSKNLSGSNLSGSSSHKVGSLPIAHALMNTWVPEATSYPLIFMSCIVSRGTIKGIGGCRRRVSLKTAFKYGIFSRSSSVTLLIYSSGMAITKRFNYNVS